MMAVRVAGSTSSPLQSSTSEEFSDADKTGIELLHGRREQSQEIKGASKGPFYCDANICEYRWLCFRVPRR